MSNKVSERTADPVAMERNLILELESCEGLDYMFEVKFRLLFFFIEGSSRIFRSLCKQI